jgi:cell wall-associated NlpC family hydrolase
VPEVVLRIAGDNVSAVAAVREFVATLRDVRVENSEVAKSSATTAQTIAETARLNVTKAIEQREALRGLVQEYATIAKAAAAGSDEAIGANRLWMESNAKLAASYGEIAAAARRSSSEAAAASARGSEESGLARGFASRTLGVGAFAGGAFIAGAAAGIVIKKAADEANRAQESQAQLSNALRRTNQSYEAQKGAIEDYLASAEKASSFDKIDLRTALSELVRATGDTTKAQTLLTTATNVARGRHMDLEGAVRLVTRAYQGNVGALRRVGIDAQTVTTAQDKLREAHVKVTPEMLKQAKAIDKQSQSLEALRLLDQRYSGAAEAHAKTLAGHEEALGNAFTDMSVAIGKAVTPALSRMFEWMAKTIEAMTKSKTVADILHDTFHALGQIVSGVVGDFDILRSTFEFVSHHVKTVLIPILAVGLVAAFTAVKYGMISLEMSMPWTAIIVGAAIAVGWIVKHWGEVKSWFGDFWGYLKDTGEAAWTFLKDLARGAVYAILQYATAAIRGILEVASHVPFIGGKAKAALNDINDYIAKWKPNFSNVVAAFGAGGNAAGAAFNRGVMSHLNNTPYRIGGAGSDSPTRGVGGPGTAQIGGAAAGPGGRLQQSIVATARSALGVPYQYGGAPSISSPTDCSGLMVAVFAKHGISLPRRSEEQYSRAPMKNMSELLAGDLVFSEGIHPGHVGLYIGGGQVLEDPHTGDHVKIVALRDFGWNGESARWWGGKKDGGGGIPSPKLPSISDLIKQGTPVTTAQKAGPTALTALGVPQGLQDAVKKAADQARNAISAGHFTAAIRFYDTERRDLEKEATDLRHKLDDPKLTSAQRDAIHKDLTAVENAIRDVGGSIRAAHKKIADAARAAMKAEETALKSKVSTLQSTVSSAFSAVSGGIISAFEAQTQALVDAAGKTFYQGAQTPEEAALAAAQSADQVKSLQDALSQAQATGDPQQIAAAQHAIDMYNLESAAAASRAKADADYAAAVQQIQADRQKAEEHLTVDLGKFGDALQAGTSTYGDLQPLLDKYGLKLGDLSDGSFIFANDLDNLHGSADALDGALRDLAVLIGQITGKPVKLPPKGGRGAGGGGGGGGGGGASACFVAGTAVSTPDGTTAIEEIDVGDLVLTWDFATARLVEAAVTAVDRHVDADARSVLRLSAGDASLVGTPDHLVHDGGGWISVIDAAALWRPGDDGPVAVDAAQIGPRADVFNLHVNHPDHNYVANGFLVHNAKAHFATGGIVPGPMIGPEDTVLARVSTGEGVLSRDEMRMLLTAALGGGAPRYGSAIRSSPIYVLGTTASEVGRALARIVTPAQQRAVGFRNY